MISDYIILHGQIKNIAIKHLEKFGQNESAAFVEELEKFLNTEKAKSKKRGIITNKRNKNDNNDNSTTTIRKYKDLIEGRFDLAKVIHIDRKDNSNTIFGKAAEFSSKTIKQLRDDGYKEAEKEIEKHLTNLQ